MSFVYRLYTLYVRHCRGDLIVQKLVLPLCSFVCSKHYTPPPLPLPHIPPAQRGLSTTITPLTFSPSTTHLLRPLLISNLPQPSCLRHLTTFRLFYLFPPLTKPSSRSLQNGRRAQRPSYLRFRRRWRIPLRRRVLRRRHRQRNLQD